MEIVQIIWLVLLALFLIVEASTAALVSMWFAAGALVALLVSLAWPQGVIVQVVVFLVVSVIALLALRPLARRLVGNRRVPTNADANVGKTAQVVREIRPERFGRVLLEGLEWTAKADVVLPAGSYCRVEGIEGVKLIVTPMEAQDGAPG